VASDLELCSSSSSGVGTAAPATPGAGLRSGGPSVASPSLGAKYSAVSPVVLAPAAGSPTPASPPQLAAGGSAGSPRALEAVGGAALLQGFVGLFCVAMGGYMGATGANRSPAIAVLIAVGAGMVPANIAAFAVART
jgi:hypothetical protein